MANSDQLASQLIRDVASVIKRKNALEKASQEGDKTREEDSATFDKLKQDLREASRQNSELKDFIADYKQQLEQMEDRLNKMDDQRKKQKETIDNLMEENLNLKKRLAGKDEADEESV